MAGRIDDMRRVADKLLLKFGERIVTMKTLPGAFNCTAFMTMTDKKHKYMLKKYFLKKNDRRDRLATEFGGLTFLWSRGFRNIPKPVIADKKEKVGVYSFIEGKKLRGKDIKLNDVLKASKLIGQMSKLNRVKGASLQPIASEACFSIRSYMGLVEKRMERLESSRAGGPIGSAMKEFVKNELEPFFSQVKRFVIVNSLKLKMDRTRVLSKIERTLSPSDVGFHNILRDNKGRIYFIDLEYFGWDDPAKTISDFFLQPDSPMPIKFRRRFFESIKRYFDKDKGLVGRLPLVYALLSVKWCQIILNVFLGVGEGRGRIVFERQLNKAKKQLHNTVREFTDLEFPLSLVNEVK